VIRTCGSVLADQRTATPRVWVTADFVVLRPITVATVDLSADGVVSDYDLSLWDTCALREDRIGDYDGDDDVDSVDREFLASQIGTRCAPSIPAQELSWGKLKATHR
jgi:hypothetical protein